MRYQRLLLSALLSVGHRSTSVLVFIFFAWLWWNIELDPAECLSILHLQPLFLLCLFRRTNRPFAQSVDHFGFRAELSHMALQGFAFEIDSLSDVNIRIGLSEEEIQLMNTIRQQTLGQ